MALPIGYCFKRGCWRQRQFPLPDPEQDYQLTHEAFINALGDWDLIIEEGKRPQFCCPYHQDDMEWRTKLREAADRQMPDVERIV